MESERQRMLQKEKRKKILLVLVIVIVGMLAVLGIINFVLEQIKGMVTDKAKEELDASLKPPSYIFYTPDYDENIFEDASYMSLNRDVRYKNGEVTIAVTEDNYSSQAEQVKFMYDIIQNIINGDYESYNAAFIDSYAENAGDDFRETFTMQKLYNIEIEGIFYNETDTNDGKMISYADFKVSYIIKNNNGTFRNDLPPDEDIYRPVVYRVMTISDTKNETYESSVYNLLLYSKYTSGLYD